MKLHHIELFLAVANHGNVTRAAEALHVTPSSISHQMRSLEKECGARLYRKVAGGIQLTEQGAVWLRKFKKGLSGMRAPTNGENGGAATGAPRGLRVGATYGAAAAILPSLFRLYRRRHPHTAITIRSGDTRLLERMLRTSEVDIALVTSPSRCASLDAEPFAEDEIVAFAAAPHAMARKRAVTLRELARAPLIVREGERTASVTSQVVKKLKRQGLKPDIVMRCDRPDAVRSSVEKGLGMGVASRAMVADWTKHGRLKAIAVPELGVRLNRCIAYRRDGSLPAEAQEFLAILRARRSCSGLSVEGAARAKSPHNGPRGNGLDPPLTR